MKITILCVGKIKERFYTQAVEEYVKRLGRYASVDISEVADEKTPDKASSHECDLIRQREGARLLSQIEGRHAYVVALAIDGRTMDSIELSQMLHERMVSGCSHIMFVIGGSLGLSSEVLRAADLHLSFSRMTFPHQLMRVILTEQIYRAFRIMNHEPYHK